MKKLIQFTALFFLFCVPVFAQQKEESPVYLFLKGNSAYAEGKFDEAISSYENIIRQKSESGNVYYNLANAYFKKGETGKAILNYERAKLFIPADSDLKANYEYALSSLKESPVALRKTWFAFVERLAQGLTIDGLTVFLSAVYFIICFSWALWLFFPALREALRYFIAIIVIVFIFAAVNFNKKITHLGKDAIITSSQAQGRFEPLDNATVYFKIPQGSRVEILEDKDNWYKVKRLDGKIGWVKESVLGLINL